MSTVNGVGGDDLRSVVLGKREQRRGERATSEGEERERGSQGCCGIVCARRGSGGKQEVAGRVLARGGHAPLILLAGG